MNWKSYVEKKNAKTYVLPPGWDSRDTIAEQLECSPEKVDDHLRPSLRSGEVVKEIFSVWDPALKRLARVIAYRETKGQAPAAATPLVSLLPTSGTPSTDVTVASCCWMADSGVQFRPKQGLLP